MKGEPCKTCVYLENCPIYKVAREAQVAFIGPFQFGCYWHRTPEEREAMLAEQSSTEGKNG